MIDTISLLKKLIACPSITPNDAGCQAIIAGLLTPAGFHCEKMRFEDVDNLWAIRGNNEPVFVFAGHTDVVPTGPQTAWTSPPFVPTIRDGYIYGRGACDMKGAIAAMIIATLHFVADKPDHRSAIGFLLTSDEEGPSINGTVKVLAKLKARGVQPKYAIVGEPSSENAIGDQIRIGRRGSFHGKLKIYGKQGHVARPLSALNPIHESMRVLDELAHTTWDEGNESFPPTTFQITNIHSGTGALNVIPGVIEVDFNFRFSPAITIDEMKQRTTALLNKMGLHYEVTWRVDAEPFLTQPGKLLEITKDAIVRYTSQEPRLSTAGGTSDARFIAPTGAEVLELGVSGATAHHIDECASLSELEALTKIYYDILCHLC